jgi:Asp-tRNA(Asn)/Glu-tRNA(Gln) amidotransferase A subunit family amidase
LTLGPGAYDHETMDERPWLDATATAQPIRSGEIRPLEAVEAAIARIGALNQKLNAFITHLFEQAQRHAASPALPE